MKLANRRSFRPLHRSPSVNRRNLMNTQHTTFLHCSQFGWNGQKRFVDRIARRAFVTFVDFVDKFLGLLQPLYWKMGTKYLLR